MDRHWIAPLAWVLLLAVAVYALLYHCVLMPVVPDGMALDLFERGIGTPALVWLNGYLGAFFNLRYLSPATALCLPLILLALVHWKRLVLWQRGLLLFTLFAVGVIGTFGSFNYRYALTLLPLFTFAVVATVFTRSTGRGRSWFLVAFAVISVMNTGLSMEHRERVWRASIGGAFIDDRDKSLGDKLDSRPRDLEGMLSRAGVGPEDTVLVNNLPIWYYSTDRPGIYYWCGSDELFLISGRPFLLKDRTDEQALLYLKDSLHCGFVFSFEDFNGYDPRFQAFMEKHMVLMEKDDRGYTLHRVADTFGR